MTDRATQGISRRRSEAFSTDSESSIVEHKRYKPEDRSVIVSEEFMPVAEEEEMSKTEILSPESQLLLSKMDEIFIKRINIMKTDLMKNIRKS